MLSLRNPYPQIQYENELSYGGDQNHADAKLMRQCGCGLIAAQDLLEYLRRYHSDSYRADFSPLPGEIYNGKLQLLSQSFLPLIPTFGIDGLSLVGGINRLLRKEHLPYHARWMVSGEKIWDRIEDMLQRDLPVILAVGPNFPAFWRKRTLRLYCRCSNGALQRSKDIFDHYVTVTGMDREWLRVLSWGHLYYINRLEYAAYAHDYSNYLFCNIVYLDNK